MRSLLTAVIVFISILYPAKLFAADASVLMAQTKAVAGGVAWDNVRSLHIVSDIEGEGLRGSSDEWIDVSHGRYLSATTLGPEKRADGFDGVNVWTRDAAGQVWIQDSNESRMASTNDSYRAACAYWFSVRHAAVMKIGSPANAQGENLDVVTIAPAGGRPFEFWISRKTHLIARMVERGGFYTRTEIYSDWGDFSGVTLPRQIVSQITSPDGQPLETRTEKRRVVRVNSPLPANVFAQPPSRVDFSFPAQKDSVSLPFELINNHIYVKANTNGQPVRLMFDTGATAILDSDTAKRLQLNAQGDVAQTGAGTRVKRGGYVTVGKLDIGGLVLRDQIFTTQHENEFSNVEGVDVDGMIGFELAHRVAVKLDYVNRQITFIKPASFSPSADFVGLPVKFLAQIPIVRAKLDSVEGDFAIDTGSRASLIVLGAYARRPELSRNPTLSNGIFGWGIGGAVRGDITRAKLLEISNLSVSRPLTVLIDHGPPVDGNIGGGILKRFDVVLDYPHKKIWLRKNSDKDAPDIYDRSGLWLNRNGRTLEVMDVLQGSPAAKAAIKVGDVIATIDGAPLSSVALASVRQKLKGQPGTTVVLGIRRGGALKRVTITLAELI